MKPYIAAFSAFAACAAFVSAPALAQNSMGGSGSGLSNPTNIVQSFSVQTVGPVLNELGMPWEVRQLNNGMQYIVAAAGEANFVIQFNACQSATSCAGLLTVTFFSGGNPNAQTVQAFNARTPFVTAGVDQDGDAYISRYDIADFGIPRGNIASSIVNFLASAQMFSEQLAQAHQTVSLEGYASDLSASHLNGKAFEGLTGTKISPSDPSLRHQASIEESAELIQMLLKDDTVPRNKITNVKN